MKKTQKILAICNILWPILSVMGLLFKSGHGMFESIILLFAIFSGLPALLIGTATLAGDTNENKAMENTVFFVASMIFGIPSILMLYQSGMLLVIVPLGLAILGLLAIRPMSYRIIYFNCLGLMLLTPNIILLAL